MTFGKFSVPDLSEIALDLDKLEQSVNETRRRKRSGNMDDTGPYPTIKRYSSDSQVTRLLLDPGTTESP